MPPAIQAFLLILHLRVYFIYEVQNLVAACLQFCRSTEHLWQLIPSFPQFTLMKIIISILFLFFALTTLTVSAQTSDSTPAEATQEKKVWIPSQVLPVAEHYEGGVEAMYKAIDKELQYPALAKRNRVQGESIISFDINEDGSTSNFKILRNPGAGTGEEAVRVARLLKFKSPGYSLNASMPILFKL